MCGSVCAAIAADARICITFFAHGLRKVNQREMANKPMQILTANKPKCAKTQRFINARFLREKQKNHSNNLYEKVVGRINPQQVKRQPPALPCSPASQAAPRQRSWRYTEKNVKGWKILFEKGQRKRAITSQSALLSILHIQLLCGYNP